MRMPYWRDQKAGSPHSSLARSGHRLGARDTPPLRHDAFAWRLTYLAGPVAPSETETVMAAPITKKEIQ
jgi:hypothetical protein